MATGCVPHIEHFPHDTLSVELFVPASVQTIRKQVVVRQTLHPTLRRLPWRWVATHARRSVQDAFRRRIDAADPDSTIAYFWPDPPLWLVVHAKAKGLTIVRQMTNCYRGTAKRILDQAYGDLGLEPGHGISESSIEQERQELRLYDFIFCAGQVAPTLREAGVEAHRILPTTSAASPTPRTLRPDRGRPGDVTALFVGMTLVRKGFPHLIEAWRRCGSPGRLLVVGETTNEVRQSMKDRRHDPTIIFAGFSDDISSAYARADFLVLPTFEEGGPKVVFEAASHGLPCITTPMGAGGFIEDGVNGLIVEAGDTDALAAAISRLASDGALRARLAARAGLDAAEFTHEKVGARRAQQLHDVLNRKGASRVSA